MSLERTAPSESAASRARLIGALCMLGAVTIYGLNFPISRHATQNGIGAYDLVALRFLVAGPLLLPVFVARGWRDCAGIGWRRGIVLALLSGFPMSLVMFAGLEFAPAAHGAAIGPGTVTVIGAVGSYLMFGQKLGWRRVVGIAVVLVGLGLVGWSGASATGTDVWKGDLLFLATGLIWGGYPLLLQRWKLDPLTSTAIVAVLSMVYLPFYFGLTFSALFTAPLPALAFHAVNQGILNIIVALWLWAKAIELMGAGVAGRFPPLIPVIGTLSAIPIVGEWPGAMQFAGVALIVGGLLVVAVVKN